jgi:HopA1 effector protein family
MIATTPEWKSIIADLKPDRQGWWDLGDGETAADWFGELPIAQQQVLSQRRLQDWLYRRLVSGVWVADADTEGERRVDGLDLAFAGALHQQNQGQGYWDADWALGAADETDHWAVSKADLTIYVWPETDLMPDVRLVSGNAVSVKLPKNLVIADRYVAVGNAGIPVGDRWQIYFHCDRETVVELMRSVTTDLNQRDWPFSLAVPYEPLDYPRQDGAILWVAQHSMAALKPLLQQWAKLIGADGAAVPLLAERLYPGIAGATIAGGTIDFGVAQCQAIAVELLSQHQV